MIRLRTGSDAWRVLGLIVRHPGQLDAGELGRRLWQPRVDAPGRVREVRAAILADQRRPDRARSWSARASVLVTRLVALGLVERARPYALSPAWAAWGAERLAELEHDPAAPVPEVLVVEAAAELDADGWGDDQGRAAHAPGLVAALVWKGPPVTGSEWIGVAPVGARKRAVARLVERGVVVAPGQRWPTPRGVDVIEGGRAP